MGANAQPMCACQNPRSILPEAPAVRVRRVRVVLAVAVLVVPAVPADPRNQRPLDGHRPEDAEKNWIGRVVSNDRCVNSRWKPTVMPRHRQHVHPDQEAEIDPAESPPPEGDARPRQTQERDRHSDEGGEPGENLPARADFRLGIERGGGIVDQWRCGGGQMIPRLVTDSRTGFAERRFGVSLLLDTRDRLSRGY